MKMVAAIGIVLILLIAAYAVVQVLSGGIIDDVDLTVDQIEVISSTTDTLTLKVGVTVDVPQKADLDATDLEVLYGGQKVGSFALPAVKLKKGANSLTVDGTLKEGSGGLLGKLVDDLLDKAEVTLQVKGDIKASGLTLELDKEVTIKGLKDLDVTVDTLELEHDGTGDVKALVKSTVENPSIIILPLNELVFEAKYNGTRLTTFDGIGKLELGTNTLNFSIPLNSRASATFNELVEATMVGRAVSLSVLGVEDETTLLDKLAGKFVFDYDFAAAGKGLEFELQGLSLGTNGDEGLELTADYTLTNPTPVTFQDLTYTADLYYGGQKVGSVHLADLDLAVGTTTEQRTLAFTDIDETAMSGFVSDYLANDVGVMELKGSLANPWVSGTHLGFSLFPTLPDLDGELGMAIESILLQEVTDEHLKVQLGLRTTNPTLFAGEVTNATFDLFENGTLIAPVTVPFIDLPAGNASLLVNLTLELDQATNLTELVERVLDGEAVALSMQGTGADNALLADFIVSLTLDTTLEATGPLNITLKEVYLEEAGADHLKLTVTLEVDNPTPFGGLLTDLVFDIGYEGEVLGTATFQDFQMGTGKQLLNQSLILTDVGGDSLSSFITELVAGNATTLEISGKPASGLLASLLEDLTLEAEFVPTGPLAIELGAITLEEVLEEGLVFGLELTVDNPLPVSGLLTDLAFQVSSDDNVLGRAELGRFDLRQGNVTYELNVDFFPGDPAPVQDLIADLLAGTATNFTLNASRHGSSSFLAEILEDMTYTTRFIPDGPFTLEVEEVTLDRVTDDSLVFGVQLDINNTMPVAGLLADLAFQVRYNDTYQGLAYLETLNLCDGPQTHYLALEFVPDDAGSLQELVASLLAGNNVTLLLNGSAAGTTSYLSTLLETVEFEFNLTANRSMVVDLKEIEVVTMGEESASLNLFMSVDNPTDLRGLVSDLAFDIFVAGEYAGSALVEDLKLKPGLRTYNLSAEFEAAANEVMGQAIGDIMDDQNVTFTVKVAPANGSGYISEVLQGLEMDFHLEATGSPAFDLELDRVTLKRVLDEGLELGLELDVINNLPFGGLVAELNFDIYREELYLGSADLPTLELTTGPYEMHPTLEFYPEDVAPLTELVQDLLGGENITLNVTVADEGTSGFLAEALAGLNFTVNITTTGPMTFELQDLMVVSMGEDSARLNITALVNNPAELGGLLSDLAFDAYFDDELGGNALVESFLLQQGEHTYYLLADFTAADNGVMGGAISTLIDGDNVTLKLVAAPANGSGYLTEVLEGLEFELELSAGGEMEFELNGIRIVEFGANSAKMALDLEVNNPSALGGILTDVALKLFEGPLYLGSLQTQDLELPQGQARFNATALLVPMHGRALNGILDRLFKGTNTTLDIEGDPDNSSGFMADFLAGFTYQLELTSQGEFTIELTSMVVDAIHEDSMEVTVQLEVFNPTDITGLLADLSFDLYYGDTFIDDVTLTDVNLVKGNNQLELSATLNPADTSNLADMAKELLSGNDVTLDVLGDQTASSEFLPGVVSGLAFELKIESEGELEIEVGNMSLLEAKDGELQLALEVDLFNPTDVQVTLDTLYFDVYRENAKAGEAFLKPVTLEPGWNQAEAVVRFTGSQAVLDDIVSDHINDQDQTFELQPADNMTDTLLGEILADMDWEITLPGIDVEFISKVKVTSIQISLSPYRVTVKVEVTLTNPTDFDVGVTYLDYDVHYDDNDPSSIPLVVTYPTKYDIYLDTITESVNPALELAAGTSKKKEGTITTSSQEHSTRLNDEYNNDDDLVVHVYGDVTLEIGGTEITVAFEQTDIRVPK